jgi:MFS family permease
MSSDRTNWAAVAFGLSLAWFAAFQMFKLPPVLPLLLETYGYDLVLAGGFMSVYAVAGLLLSLGFGRRIERSGWHRPLLGALAVLACGNILGLIWPQSGWILLVARALEGIGFAVLAIIGPTLANRQAAARHLPIVIGATARAGRASGSSASWDAWFSPPGADGFRPTVRRPERAPRTPPVGSRDSARGVCWC